MSALSAFRSVRFVGTGLPSEAIPRASDLRMRGQKPPTTSCRPGWASTPPSHEPGTRCSQPTTSGTTHWAGLPTATQQSKWPAKSGCCQSFTNWAVGISKRSPGVRLSPGLDEATAAHFAISHAVS